MSFHLPRIVPPLCVLSAGILALTDESSAQVMPRRNSRTLSADMAEAGRGPFHARDPVNRSTGAGPAPERDPGDGRRGTSRVGTIGLIPGVRDRRWRGLSCWQHAARRTRHGRAPAYVRNVLRT